MDLFTSANPGYQQKINFELSFLQPNSPLAQMHFNAFFSLGFNEFDAANPIFAGLGETDPTDDAGTICQAEPPVAHVEVLALDCISEAATTSGGLENAAELYAVCPACTAPTSSHVRGLLVNALYVKRVS